MKTTVDRFNKSRWSDTRKTISTLTPGQVQDFPASEYFNVHSSVMRLNDAYNGSKVWELSGGRQRPFVKRIK